MFETGRKGRESNGNREIVALLHFLMDLIARAGPAQVIPESRWLKNWGSNLREEYRRARRAGRLRSQKIKCTHERDDIVYSLFS
jgi:hypothetical protein